MNTYEYHQLLQAFCKEVGLDAPKLIQDGLVTVDGMDMLLFYDEQKNAELLVIRMDFGRCPDELAPIMWRALLAANHNLGPDALCTFSMHPSEGNIVLTLNTKMTHNTDAQELIHALRNHVQEARRCWGGIQAAVGVLSKKDALRGKGVV
jgi:hypothetical protein